MKLYVGFLMDDFNSNEPVCIGFNKEMVKKATTEYHDYDTIEYIGEFELNDDTVIDFFSSEILQTITKI